MIQGILVVFGFFLISWIFEMVIAATIGRQTREMDIKVGVDTEDSLASPLFISLSAVRVAGLLYLINLSYDMKVPIITFLIIAVIELYIGCSLMMQYDNRGMPHLRNYNTGKTIGSFIGLALMTYVIYFR